MKAGIFYSKASKSMPSDLITWHDRLPLRIFIHSREMSDGSRSIISLTSQFVGQKPVKVSEEEKNLRIKLAAHAPSVENKGVTSLQMRNLPIGQILEEHSEMIASNLQRIGKNQNPEISLVTQIQSVSKERLKLNKIDTPSEIAQLGANSGDAILISMIYALMYSTGPSKVAKRTADFMQIDLETVRTAVRIARRNEWLTSEGHGKSGGFLTEKGVKTFLQFNGPYRLNKLYGLQYTKRKK